MDRDAARVVLGVDASAPADEVRRAFRRLLLRHHPDVAAGADADAATRALTEAYRVLSSTNTEPAVESTPVTAATSTGGDTIELAMPPDEAFVHLVEAGSRIGEVTYVDVDAGLLEVIVTMDDASVVSLVITLQGRASGTTEAFCTVESLGHRQPPPLGVVLDALLRAMSDHPA